MIAPEGRALGCAILSLFALAMPAFCAESAPAEQPAIERLLQSQTMPTVEDLVGAFPKWPLRNPFEHHPFVEGQARASMPDALYDAPNVIASLEAAYPGATWAVLGRDALALGNALTAFYRSIGQSHRVVRLDISESSFAGHPSDELLVDYLKGKGLDLKKIENGKPFILLDSTSYNPEIRMLSVTGESYVHRQASQSRRLIQAAYRAFTASGRDPRDIVKKLAVVNFDPGRARGSPEHVAFDKARLDVFFSDVTKNLTPDGPAKILLVDGHMIAYGPQSLWTKSYGPFVRLADGLVSTVAPEVYDVDSRQEVLWQMFEMIGGVAAPGFRERVFAKGAQLGLTFQASSNPCELLLAPVR